jgi:hypothetical protein
VPFNIRVNNQKAGRIDNTLRNTFFGYKAGDANTTGTSNTASGMFALNRNTTGEGNTANGYGALDVNTTGTGNTATGRSVLSSNTTGNGNTANGSYALISNATGNGNTAIGYESLWKNSDGNNNVGIGMGAGYSANGTGNVFLGSQAGYYETGSNKLFIDNSPRLNEADGREKALIYGVFAVTPADQKLTINANVGIGTTTPTSKLQVVGLPVYANNAAAIAGGLTVGAFYRTGADPDPVMVVH